MIKNLVFDMGNVLLTYNPEVCLDYFLEKEEDKAVIRQELFEGAEWEQGDLGLLTDIERFYEVRKRVPERLHEALKNCAVEWPMCMKPVSGAREFCDFARKNGYQLYVLSNASGSFYDYFPNFAPFTYFDGILVSCDVGMIKPDGRIYQHLFEKYELRPEECFFVDDRRENIEAARQEGMEGIVFEGDYDAVRQTLTEVAVEKVRDTFQASTDAKYMEFNRSLVPGEIAPMLGVRMPRLREIAKALAKTGGREYIRGIRQEEKRGQAYHEELLLHGMVIGYLKCTCKERQKLLDDFVPVINNWAVCDSSCMTYKFMKKEPEEWFSYLQKYVNSENTYEIRFAVVAMLDHFVEEQFLDRVLDLLNHIRHEDYYVKMAVAWAVSVCFVKFPERTKLFLQKNELDDFTQNKSIQKIRESFRAKKEDKEVILKWKR